MRRPRRHAAGEWKTARVGEFWADTLVPRRCVHCRSLLVNAAPRDSHRGVPGHRGVAHDRATTEHSTPVHTSGLCGACRFLLAASEIPTFDMPYVIDRWPLAVRWVFSDQSPVRSLHHAFKYEGRPELADILAAGLHASLWHILQPGQNLSQAVERPALNMRQAVERPTLNMRQAVVVPVPSHRLRILERGYCQAAVLAGRAARHLGCRAAPGALARREHAGSQTRLHARQRLENVHAAFEVNYIPEGNPIIILDDVITTGATLHACAARMEEALRSAIPANRLAIRPAAPTILVAAPAIRPPLPIGRTINLLQVEEPRKK